MISDTFSSNVQIIWSLFLTGILFPTNKQKRPILIGWKNLWKYEIPAGISKCLWTPTLHHQMYGRWSGVFWLLFLTGIPPLLLAKQWTCWGRRLPYPKGRKIGCLWWPYLWVNIDLAGNPKSLWTPTLHHQMYGRWSGVFWHLFLTGIPPPLLAKQWTCWCRRLIVDLWAIAKITLPLPFFRLALGWNCKAF